MCHCIFFGINPRVSKHHAFRLHRATLACVIKLNIGILQIHKISNYQFFNVQSNLVWFESHFILCISSGKKIRIFSPVNQLLINKVALWVTKKKYKNINIKVAYHFF